MVNFEFWPRAAPGAGRVTFVAWREIICEYLPENCARDGFGSRPGPKPKIDHPGRGGGSSQEALFSKLGFCFSGSGYPGVIGFLFACQINCFSYIECPRNRDVLAPKPKCTQHAAPLTLGTFSKNDEKQWI